MNKTSAEILTQPVCWRRAAALAATPEVRDMLPSAGDEVAVVGCGTSLYIAQAYAAAREAAGHGVSDAFAASEYPAARSYGRLLAISRSGTTSEVETVLEALPSGSAPLLITAVGDSPAAAAAGESIVLDFADEESVVQTRFATSALALLRASLGHDVGRAADDAARALEADLPLAPGSVAQVTFLGTGWTVGLAFEAALKLREAAQAWTEAYPAMEYRHGPIAIAAPGRAVWPLGPLPRGLADDIAASGATLVDNGELDPMAALVLAQRFAVAEAEHRGLDPDQPRNLTRSVILPFLETGRGSQT
jgi:fructoselysine-6-P-deglycase FrlB-like protein